MINMSEIKNRIGAIGQTRKITSAMHLISSVKLRKALEKQSMNKAYIDRIRSILKDILIHSGEIEHPFINDKPGSRTAFIVIAGDKGLQHRQGDLARPPSTTHRVPAVSLATNHPGLREPGPDRLRWTPVPVAGSPF